MKFEGNGVVWDKENDKVLVKFEDGSYETDDKEIQKKLHDLGFKHDGEIADDNDDRDLEDRSAEELQKVTKDDLKKRLDELDIEYGASDNKDALIAALKGDE